MTMYLSYILKIVVGSFNILLQYQFFAIQELTKMDPAR